MQAIASEALVMIKALSIRQPCAWLIVKGIKTIEIRSWQTAFRGRFAIHAGKARPTEEEIAKIEADFGVKIPRKALVYGAVIGLADLIDCVSVAHEEEYWFALARPRPIVPVYMTGQVGLFNATLPDFPAHG